MRRFLVLALVLSLLLAGCGGAITTDEPTATTTGTSSGSEMPTTAETTATLRTTPSTVEQWGQYDIDVVGGELPVDPNRTFARVQSMLGTNVSGPSYIAITPNDEMRRRSKFPRFYRLLGIELSEGRNATFTASGLTTPENIIYLNRKLLSNRSATEVVIAHEYVHNVQFKTGAIRTLGKKFDIGWRPSSDTQLVVSSVIEGGATYVMRRYEKRYLNTSQRNVVNTTRGYWNESAARQYALAPYYYGSRYAASRVDSPRALDVLYERPPQTTEEIIHRLSPGSEPPANLSVSAEGANWTATVLNQSGRMGELFVRISLLTELNRSAAIRGADGWGNDRRLAFVNDGQRGYAWVLRWDDAANATEFENVFRTYLSKRATPENGMWHDGDTAFRIERVSNRTVVVFLGAPSFVETAESNESDRNVVIHA